jgi:hypothetical protein
MYKSVGRVLLSDLYTLHKRGKDSCQGDSGGPLIVSDSDIKAVIYGIGLFHVKIPSSQIILNLKSQRKKNRGKN